MPARLPAARAARSAGCRRRARGCAGSRAGEHVGQHERVGVGAVARQEDQRVARVELAQRLRARRCRPAPSTPWRAAAAAPGEEVDGRPGPSTATSPRGRRRPRRAPRPRGGSSRRGEQRRPRAGTPRLPWIASTTCRGTLIAPADELALGAVEGQRGLVGDEGGERAGAVPPAGELGHGGGLGFDDVRAVGVAAQRRLLQRTRGSAWQRERGGGQRSPSSPALVALPRSAWQPRHAQRRHQRSRVGVRQRTGERLGLQRQHRRPAARRGRAARPRPAAAPPRSRRRRARSPGRRCPAVPSCPPPHRRNP